MKTHDGANERIRQFITMKIPLISRQADIDDKESLINDGIIDSLGILYLVTFLEKEFEIMVSTDGCSI